MSIAADLESKPVHLHARHIATHFVKYATGLLAMQSKMAATRRRTSSPPPGGVGKSQALPLQHSPMSLHFSSSSQSLLLKQMSNWQAGPYLSTAQRQMPS